LLLLLPLLLLLLLQAMLEEDGLRFDAFLKENDEKVQEAIKRADTEAKARQDKVRDVLHWLGVLHTVATELQLERSRLSQCVKRVLRWCSCAASQFLVRQPSQRMAKHAGCCWFSFCSAAG
jgi:hypothetical protein